MLCYHRYAACGCCSPWKRIHSKSDDTNWTVDNKQLQCGFRSWSQPKTLYCSLGKTFVMWSSVSFKRLELTALVCHVLTAWFGGESQN